MAKKTIKRPKTNPARVELVKLEKLRLDTGNPRFGSQAGKLKTEVAILDTIVQKFGVEDVLSSLAVNGYFDAEPLVGIRGKKPGEFRIVEGNRRLAACLILANDERAVHHRARAVASQKIQEEHENKPITEVPVSVFEEKEWRAELLPYLGVRHIAASQPWDSYAKAAWIARVLENGDLTLDDVIQMIGDQHRTTPRMLEGFYFVHQLMDEARFKPGDSLRKGRGSNPDYPFSWVYTALGYSPIRRWLDLADMSEGKKKAPVPKKRLDDAEDFVTFLFGNKSTAQAAAINDSRNISDLAKAIGDPAKRQLLKRGKTVAEVIELTKPAQERVVSGLLDAQDALNGVLITLSESEINTEQAKELVDPSTKVFTVAKNVHKRIKLAFAGPDEDADD